MKIKHVYFLIAFSVLTSGCTPVTESSGKVLDNAGSVIRSGSENLWIPPEQDKKVTEEEKKPATDHRY